MKNQKKVFLYATATVIGYIMGAGLFGLPYVMQRLGFIPGVFFLTLVTILTLINCLNLIEIMLRTPGAYYFPNLAKIYLGWPGKLLQLISLCVGGLGAILAYYILGGVFLKTNTENLFNLDLPTYVYVLIFIALGIFLIWKGVEDLGRAELIMTGLLIGIIILILMASLGQVNLRNFGNTNLNQFFPAAGVMLFALDSIGSLFIIKQILKKQKKNLAQSVLIAYALVFVLLLFFSFSLIGVYGAAVQQEALIGIGDKLGRFVEITAVGFGFLAVFSSFVVVGASLKNTLICDFKINNKIAWLIAWALPLGLYLAGIDNFIAVISLLGVFFGVFNSILITVLLKKARLKGKRRPEFHVNLPYWLNYLLIGFFIIGFLSQVKSFFS
ncbi:MAG: hypothetical protein GF332_00975 [Candidatus Moranbacteria bacterium]|nr:hypothetical protein [Candidatus Moranbacteria bacterium]